MGKDLNNSGPTVMARLGQSISKNVGWPQLLVGNKVVQVRTAGEQATGSWTPRTCQQESGVKGS